jgi:hypothetical protein
MVQGVRAKLRVRQQGKNPELLKTAAEPVSGHVQHVDIQNMAKDHIQSFKLPVVYQGKVLCWKNN